MTEIHIHKGFRYMRASNEFDKVKFQLAKSQTLEWRSWGLPSGFYLLQHLKKPMGVYPKLAGTTTVSTILVVIAINKLIFNTLLKK